VLRYLPRVYQRNDSRRTPQSGHLRLAEWGCLIEPKGSGMVVTMTLSSGRVLAAKASLLGRWASKASLERVLGPYTEPAPDSPQHAAPRKSYEQFLARERQAAERRALTDALPRAEVWRRWLERQAAADDEAAQAALRGIRYRERRNPREEGARKSMRHGTSSTAEPTAPKSSAMWDRGS
jgi:hypothetical protein